ncbi:ZIP family metal transporter [Patescibacteria group bacterium]|nr:ZIP family metal transporter [Patescibacteria group bacterium]MBU1895800.1 ZIP family metal transporter [Patescibacteria group bacterium]
MSPFLWIILTTFLISSVALVGIFTLSLKEDFLNKILLTLVSLSSGTLLGGAFIHLIPEGVEQMNAEKFFLLVLTALILYLLIEKLLHWRHCHNTGGHCESHKVVGHMNLIGDSVHNFIDGLIIATTFLVSVPLGITTAIAIGLHEIPQEIGDFGVLLYSGFKKKKALTLNFMVALMTVLGGVAGWFISSRVENVSVYFLPIAAGGFIYIAVSDLLPEMRKETSLGKFLFNLFIMLLGVGLMWAVKVLGGE